MRNRIEEYRKPLGLSQHRLSKKVGVSRTSINHHIETEKTIPSLKLANEIAAALNSRMYKAFDLDGNETYCCKNCNCDSKASLY